MPIESLRPQPAHQQHAQPSSARQGARLRGAGQPEASEATEESHVDLAKSKHGAVDAGDGITFSSKKSLHEYSNAVRESAKALATSESSGKGLKALTILAVGTIGTALGAVAVAIWAHYHDKKLIKKLQAQQQSG